MFKGNTSLKQLSKPLYFQLTHMVLDAVFLKVQGPTGPDGGIFREPRMLKIFDAEVIIYG